MQTVNSPEAVNELPAEYREILIHQLLAHTEGELSGADTYILMAPHAPNAEELKLIYEAAADEINHYMIGAQLLKDLGVDTSHMLKQSLKDRRHYPSDFVHDYSSWIERGLVSMLSEAAALEHILEMSQSSYLPLAESCAVVLQEESQHISHGYRIIKDICKTDEGKIRVQEVLDWKWGQVLDLFGSSSSGRSKLFLKWGLRQRSNEQARNEFIAKKTPKLESLGLRVPASNLNRKYM